MINGITAIQDQDNNPPKTMAATTANDITAKCLLGDHAIRRVGNELSIDIDNIRRAA